MTLRIHTNKDTIDITTKASLSVSEIVTQLEQGNLVLIETIYGSMFIVNALNITAIEILDFISQKT